MTEQIFKEFLEKKEIPFEEKDMGDKKIFLVEYPIPFGKYVGRIVNVGFPIPKDFPNSAPYGLHIKKDHNFEESIPKQNPSPLGEGWEFWSRGIKWDNPQQRTAQYFFDHVNRWLEVI